jgi:hypothetical protein
MPLDATCFTNAKAFSGFDQAEVIGALKGATLIDFESNSNGVAIKSVTQAAPLSAGQCYAYTVEWILKMKSNKKYMVKSLNTLGGIKVQQDMADKWATSGLGNSIVLNLGKQSPRLANDLLLVANHKNNLDDYRDRKANFVLIYVAGKYNMPPAQGNNSWAHVIALKLDQSYTGGWMNNTYPCAMFDCNVGQGMYNNHTEMANDLAVLLNEYTQTFGLITRIDSYLLAYGSDMD